MRDQSDVRKKNYDGATGEDQFNFEALPKVMQVKEFGKRGRTKYTHLLDQVIYTLSYSKIFMS